MKTLWIIVAVAVVLLLAFLFARATTKKGGDKFAALCAPLGLEVLDVSSIQACAGEVDGHRVIVALGSRYGYGRPSVSTLAVEVFVERDGPTASGDVPEGTRLKQGGDVPEGSALALASKAKWGAVWPNAYVMGFPEEFSGGEITSNTLKEAIERMIR